MRARLSIVALALFVAVDLFLVALAVRHVQSPAGQTGSEQQSAASAAPSSDSTTGSTEPTVTPSSDQVDYLAVADDGSMMRASRGDCSGSTKPSVGVSDDNGKTFDAPTILQLAEVLEARVISRKRLMLVGLDNRCQVGRYSSEDGGQSWTRTPGDGGAWHLSADKAASTVATPLGRRDTPCPVQAVSTVDNSVVRLLCEDGTILGTDDVGQTWVSLGRLAGAADIRFASPAGGVALAKQPNCPAAVMQSVDGGNAWGELTCLPGTRPRAIGAQGGIVAAQVGTKLYVSTDGGTTWPGPAGG